MAAFKPATFPPCHHRSPVFHTKGFPCCDLCSHSPALQSPESATHCWLCRSGGRVPFNIMPYPSGLLLPVSPLCLLLRPPARLPPHIDSTSTWAEQSKSTTPLPGQSFMADTNVRLSRELVQLPGHPPTATTTAIAVGSGLCCCCHHGKLLRCLPCTARVLCPAMGSSDSAGACAVFFDQFPYVSSPSSLPCARAVTVAPSVPTLHASTVEHHHCS